MAVLGLGYVVTGRFHSRPRWVIAVDFPVVGQPVTSSPRRARDHAMLVLAAQTGLRISD